MRGREDKGTTIVCLDFDGTLVDDEGRIHPADVELLANERSVAFVPATGRPLHSVRRTFERYELFVGRPIPFPLVLENGAAVYDENEELRAQRCFDPDLQDALMRVVLASTGANFLIYSLDEVGLLRPDEKLLSLVRRFDMDPQPFDPDAMKPLTKVAATAGDLETLRAFEASTAGLPLELTYSLPNVLELTPVGVHKGQGLATLLDGTERADAGGEVVVAGDGENDLALFDLATLSFAPADSPPEIRARADRVLDVRKEGLLTPILREVRARANGA
ncbi:HAD family hydrolase [Rubrobacter marinus]|uniref:HAD family hydrolase n=1 Tax=Rubrobacter marinus TaxID=2653852 RepID=UPI00140DEA33|nr:HAD family hydrolase [Rubrobacter marinus]